MATTETEIIQIRASLVAMQTAIKNKNGNYKRTLMDQSKTIDDLNKNYKDLKEKAKGLPPSKVKDIFQLGIDIDTMVAEIRTLIDTTRATRESDNSLLTIVSSAINVEEGRTDSPDPGASTEHIGTVSDATSSREQIVRVVPKVETAEIVSQSNSPARADSPPIKPVEREDTSVATVDPSLTQNPRTPAAVAEEEEDGEDKKSKSPGDGNKDEDKPDLWPEFKNGDWVDILMWVLAMLITASSKMAPGEGQNKDAKTIFQGLRDAIAEKWQEFRENHAIIAAVADVAAAPIKAAVYGAKAAVNLAVGVGKVGGALVGAVATTAALPYIAATSGLKGIKDSYQASWNLTKSGALDGVDGIRNVGAAVTSTINGVRDAVTIVPRGIGALYKFARAEKGHGREAAAQFEQRYQASAVVRWLDNKENLWSGSIKSSTAAATSETPITSVANAQEEPSVTSTLAANHTPRPELAATTTAHTTSDLGPTAEGTTLSPRPLTDAAQLDAPTPEPRTPSQATDRLTSTPEREPSHSENGQQQVSTAPTVTLSPFPDDPNAPPLLSVSMARMQAELSSLNSNPHADSAAATDLETSDRTLPGYRAAQSQPSVVFKMLGITRQQQALLEEEDDYEEEMDENQSPQTTTSPRPRRSMSN